ncbi:hypothetical protein VM1G_02305 [Cytospora mali]|uniref:Uncharacterized protein n=1 Tax=Cytospora mali TaxID=578113 RepID=A0A194VS17_CYTMA|nr:hypothetical protein VM1G_02305 [Valsa mali]
MCSDDGESGKAASRREWEEMEKLRQENEQLRTDLEDCKDQLFDILQKDNDIPEQDIKDSFARIFTGIDSWIDEISSESGFEADFKSRYLQNLHANDKKKKFADLGLDLRYYTNISWLVELSKSKCCHIVVISLAISDFLTHEVFRKEKTNEWGNLYPHGIDDDDVNFLVRVQEDMRDNLKRDEPEISRWRRQAVSALLTELKTKEAVEKTSANLLGRLKQNLEPWLGDLSNELSELLKTNVIMRATMTLDMICRSNKIYVIESHNVIPGPVLNEMEKSWPAREISSWRKMTASSMTGLLLCLYPGVLRVGESGQGEVILVKPTLLGYKNLEFQPPPTPLPSRSPSPPKDGATRQEHQGPDAASPRSNQKKSSSTQLTRMGEIRSQRSRRAGFMDRFSNVFWSSTPSSSGRPPGYTSPTKRPQTTSPHQRRHIGPRSPAPETYPASQVVPQQELGYLQAQGSSGRATADLVRRSHGIVTDY